MIVQRDEGDVGRKKIDQCIVQLAQYILQNRSDSFEILVEVFGYGRY
jgi:hypothetical protein